MNPTENQLRAAQAAHNRTGEPLEDCIEKVLSGLQHCPKCNKWEPAIYFINRNARHTSICLSYRKKETETGPNDISIKYGQLERIYDVALAMVEAQRIKEKAGFMANFKTLRRLVYDFRK